jgi:hypothetical protein
VALQLQSASPSSQQVLRVAIFNMSMWFVVQDALNLRPFVAENRRLFAFLAADVRGSLHSLAGQQPAVSRVRKAMQGSQAPVLSTAIEDGIRETNTLLRQQRAPLLNFSALVLRWPGSAQTIQGRVCCGR